MCSLRVRSSCFTQITSQLNIDVMLVFQRQMFFNLQYMLILRNLVDFYNDFANVPHVTDR
jgi:hypothetical protein